MTLSRFLITLTVTALTTACSQPADDAERAQPVAAAAATLELTGSSWQVQDIDGGADSTYKGHYVRSEAVGAS